ncbi:protein of unknown function [Bradyrhizobium vignae]|uniref:2-oxoadipate dioxygenase/decarboxylase n=1 Tax=Bradyrhizobium vignae TaxID=1549949 RepID=A0A2U3Q5N1_9BRAD|nr:protein of unknown function [Bradyrhizobium vignae]
MPALRADADEIRTLFSRAMSDMYRVEVPQYGTLMELVNDTNRETLRQHEELRASLERSDELERLNVERHGAVRLGRADELFDMRRVFAVMGMHPVGYYDLSVAGVPVHATAFRPIDDAALRRNPFRVFTSLLRLDLIEDETLRAQAERILGERRIFTPRALELVNIFETEGHLTVAQAEEFVREALDTFRWHSEATVSLEVYKRLHDAHRLIADVVSFRGPHINHLTPRTLDIDAVQAGVPRRGIAPKAVIEGPPRRDCPILLRQTSFKALEEPILFRQANATKVAGTHTARFGEIEQRGAALTSKGRELYDRLLASVRQAGATARDYDTELADQFKAFPDDGRSFARRGSPSSAIWRRKQALRHAGGTLRHPASRIWCLRAFCTTIRSSTRISSLSARQESSSRISAPTSSRTTPRVPTGLRSKPPSVPRFTTRWSFTRGRKGIPWSKLWSSSDHRTSHATRWPNRTAFQTSKRKPP